MRYKSQILVYYIKYAHENRHLLKCKKGENESYPFSGSMELDLFIQRYHTFQWLDKFNYYFHNNGTDFIKPSKNSIIEAMKYIKEEGLNELEWLKDYHGDIRKSLRNMAMKRIECADYYTKLAESGFLMISIS